MDEDSEDVDEDGEEEDEDSWEYGDGESDLMHCFLAAIVVCFSACNRCPLCTGFVSRSFKGIENFWQECS